MDPITPLVPTIEEHRAEAVERLAGSLGTDAATLAGLLFGALDRMAAWCAVKEVATGHYLHVSRPMAEAFGRTPEEFAGLTDADLMDAARAAAIKVSEQAALGQLAMPSAEQRLELTGSKHDFTVFRVPVARADGSPPRHLLSVWLDSTATHRLETQLQRALAQLEQQQTVADLDRRDAADQSIRDGLTGLYHPAHFEDQLRREVDLSSREHREFALVMIALDPIAAAAGELGPTAKIRVLEALGQLLRGNTRAMDASCRLDGDRFSILLSGVGLATAHSRMEGLRRQCATQIIVLDGQDFGFTVSMGVASFPHTAHTEVALLAAAGTALVEAQRRGGNRVTLASIRFQAAKD